MSFEEGAVLEDAEWQAPEYCFGKGDETETSNDNALISEPVAGHDKGFFPRREFWEASCILLLSGETQDLN